MIIDEEIEVLKDSSVPTTSKKISVHRAERDPFCAFLGKFYHLNSHHTMYLRMHASECDKFPPMAKISLRAQNKRAKNKQ